MMSKRKLGLIALVLAAFVVILVVASVFVLRSNGFHRYLLAKLQEKASTALGGPVQINNFVLHLHTLSAEAYGITIRGSEPKTSRPLAQVDQLSVQIKIVSLIHKQVDLKEIILRHPVVNLLIKQDGSSNLPTPPKSNSSGSTNVFDLGIQHVLLSEGEVYYNDVEKPLNAELHDLQFEIKSQLAQKGFDGALSYRDGKLQYGDTNPLPHNLQAKFSATPSEFTLKPLLLSVASSTLQVDGSVQDYSHPVANATYTVTVRPQEFRAALKNSSLPNGEAVVAGSLQYKYQENVPLLRCLSMNGRVSSREFYVSSTDVRAFIRNIRGDFKLANGNLFTRGIEADLLGGHVSLAANIQHMDTKPRSEVHASVQAISIADVKRALRNANVKSLPVDGHIDAAADAAWADSIQNIKAHSDVRLTANLVNASSSATSVPVNGEMRVSYDGRSSAATLTDTFIRTPQTRVDIGGIAGPRLNLTARLQAADLRELDSLAAVLQSNTQSAQKGSAVGSLNLGGAADMQVFVEGSTNDPRIRGELSGQNLQVEDTQWRTLRLGFQASKSAVSVQNGSLVNARQGYVNFAFSSTLSDWNYLPSSTITAQLASRGLAIKQLLRAARLDYPVTGNLSVNVSMHGSQLNPVGDGSIRLLQANVYGQPMQQLAADFHGNGNALATSLKVSMPAGSAQTNLTFYPKNKGYEFQLDAPGFKLAELQPVRERNVDLNGVVTATASGRGTLDDPQLTATIQAPQLQVHEASIFGIKADLNVANHRAQVALDSQVAQAYVKAQGTVDLSPAYYTRATLDTKGIPIEGLLALSSPAKSNGPRGIVEVHASAEGPMNEPSRMRAEITIPTLNASIQGLEIGNKRPVHIRYVNSVISLDPTEIAGTDTTLRMQGQLPLAGQAPVTLSATGTVNMQLLRFFQPDIQSSGNVLLDVSGTKAGDHPTVQGQLRIQNVALTTPDAPVGLQNLNGTLDIKNDQVNISQLTCESGGGQISATGFIGYRPQLQMNVALHAKSVRIRYLDAVRTVLDGDLNLVGTSEAANLNGRVLIDSLGFTQNFDLASLAGQVESGPEASPSEGLAQNLKLNIAVQTSRDLNATSSEVSLQGQADLHVIGTAADPVIVGRTEITSGDIFLMNRRYQVERGVIEFSNPNRTEPVLNVLLTTTVNQYNLNLTFVGPLDKLQTSYVSDPPLPTADIINLIARGQTTEQAAQSPSNFGASSLLAQGAASQVSSGVQKLAGLSSFSIDPTLGGNDTDPGARVAMQKRVTKSFLFTFATDVTSTQRELIQGEYQFNKRWSASVTRDENGGVAVDGKFHKRF